MKSERDIKGAPFIYDSGLDEILEGLAGRVKVLRSKGTLGPEALKRIGKFFRIKHIYHSNAIEGNVLNVGETRQVVEQGLTLTGVPLKDQAEARNLSAALDFLEELASNPNRPITEADVRQIHNLVLGGINDENAGRYRTVPVNISGSAFSPPGPESVAAAMQSFGSWLVANSSPGEKFASTEGLLRATVAHTWFVQIHPFIDGNGRVARLLMNLILMRYGFPVAVITKEDRSRYYDTLEESQSSNLAPLIDLLCESVEESLEEYERAAEAERVQVEWARSIADRFTQPQRIRAHNEYEVWRSAMDLLRSYFQQTVAAIDEVSTMGRVYFKEFGTLEFEKYISLRQGESAKRTWFFRIDFRIDDAAARYLFFFGRTSFQMRDYCRDVSVLVAREERPFFFDRLENLSAPNVPNLCEIGYVPSEEKFAARYRHGVVELDKIENIGRKFIEEVVRMHFSQK